MVCGLRLSQQISPKAAICTLPMTTGKSKQGRGETERDKEREEERDGEGWRKNAIGQNKAETRAARRELSAHFVFAAAAVGLPGV